MKKILVMLTLFFVFTLSITAQDSSAVNQSQFSYVNVPILKVYEGKDAYLIIYQKNNVGVGKTVVPKKWIHGTPDNPKKLKIRSARTTDDAYMCVVKREGEFVRVVLNIPLSKLNPIWGVADYRKPIEGSDKDTLEELDL